MKMKPRKHTDKPTRGPHAVRGVSSFSLNPRAPGERQATAAGLYYGAMKMPPSYCPATSPAASFGTEIFFHRTIYASRRAKALKMWNSVGILWNSSPILSSPFAPGGSLSFPCQPVFVRRLANYARQAARLAVGVASGYAEAPLRWQRGGPGA